MHWKKCVYWLIPLSLISSFVAEIVTDVSHPLAWGNILGNFAASTFFILIGFVMVADYKNLLDWFDIHIGWTVSPTWWFRVIGCICLLASLFLLAITMTNALAALGVIPDPYPRW